MTPTTQLVAITRADGSVALMQFVTSSPRDGWTREASAENIEAEIRKAGLDAVSWRLADVSELPPTRAYREAWADRAGRVSVDMPRAREVMRRRLRAQRTEALAALDVEYQRADERGDGTEKARIAARKQKLRDAPADPRIEAATTTDDLDALLRQFADSGSNVEQTSESHTASRDASSMAGDLSGSSPAARTPEAE